MSEKLNLSDPIFNGKFFETNEENTELTAPPVNFQVIKAIEEVDSIDQQCNYSGCGNQIKISEEGNSQYAWYYLNNSSSKYADVTIERRWIYGGSWRRETVAHKLYPGERREVFSFPRNQNPLCCIVACNIL